MPLFKFCRPERIAPSRKFDPFQVFVARDIFIYPSATGFLFVADIVF